MAKTISRRDMLRMGALMAAPAILKLTGTPAAAQAGRLRISWWGGADRAKRTQAAIDAFKGLNVGLDIVPESVGWDAYWTKLATQVAGGNPPDIIQMDYRYLPEYARRGALRPLDDLIPSVIDASDYVPSVIEAGKIDGKQFGIPMGMNSDVLLYDKTMLEKLGLPAPTPEMSWAEFTTLGENITKKANKRGYFGAADPSIMEPEFEFWVLTRGRTLYDASGKLGFTRDDAESWLALCAEMRAKGAIAPPELAATDKITIDSDLLTTGHAAITFTNSNQIVGYQAANKGKIGMAFHPKGDKPGEYLKPSMMLCVSATAADPKMAAALIDFMVLKPGGAKLLGVERGVSPSAKIRDLLAGDLDETGRIQVDHLSALSKRGPAPLPPAPPKGAAEVTALIRQAAEKAGFKQLTPKQAADQLVSEAERVLSKA
ncbi:ABC transporter substrate-binding protein [Bosea beijingensis]|uniref:ABC transporter substrate-binding protein n=1 Tax=Bosea beijingensis TaxID=3068632 RepID=UPI0027421437|nr:sugar ABC transporter substrate-binding protein [Bosea sp. REN20]